MILWLFTVLPGLGRDASNSANSVASVTDVRPFGYFERQTVHDFLTKFSLKLADRVATGMRTSITRQGITFCRVCARACTYQTCCAVPHANGQPPGYVVLRLCSSQGRCVPVLAGVDVDVDGDGVMG